MAKTDKDGNWIDARGRSIPEEYIPVLDRKRDAMVEACIKAATKLQDAMIATKLDVIDRVNTYLEEVRKANRVREGWKGNVALDNFDGTKRVERSMDDQVNFDEKLQMVKTLLDKWMSSRLNGIDDNLAKVISQAFNVDKRGRINVAMILRLRHIDIKDKDWVHAMKILDEAIVVTATKCYIRFFQREIVNGAAGNWEPIVLNFAALSSEAAE